MPPPSDAATAPPAAGPVRPEAAARPSGRPRDTAPSAGPTVQGTSPRATSRRTSTSTARPASGQARARRRAPVLVLVLTLLCLAAAAGAGVLVWQRMEPRYVDAEVLSATRSNLQDVYAYDYRDSEGSVQGKLDALTGELRDQYEADLGEGGIIDTYEQVSATTRYEVADVGLQQINEAQDTATLVVFGSYVVESATTGREPAPQGSECQVTPEGAQSCVQTLQVRTVRIDGEWKIDELTVLTSS